MPSLGSNAETLQTPGPARWAIDGDVDEWEVGLPHAAAFVGRRAPSRATCSTRSPTREASLLAHAPASARSPRGPGRDPRAARGRHGLRPRSTGRRPEWN